MVALNRAATLHVRLEGRSADIPLSDLDVGPVLSDQAIKDAVARYLEVPAPKFRDSVVDRHENGNLTIRPQAVFG